ncbi:MAG: 2-polyprenyl-3-methyl-6-methoxy-1,4-benzoquinone monooxygenase [Gammaproteobacteria bacterium]|nr:2-polyprenyl-3-methyl-6-methoxy-1,4-benzoquinone monooxygenase [Gammaproteobacteria bacterium]
MNNSRHYSRLDHAIIGVSRALQTLGARPRAARAFPADEAADQAADTALSEHERRRAGRYMRVNHVGEICAQALYHSQALTARDRRIRARMERAAAEENDHLAWCEQRLEELGAHKSYLNPLWYLGAFGVGAAAGLAGDRWNLALVAETERQVVAHLEGHLGKLPDNDTRSRAVVARMKEEERGHAEQAVQDGAAELPPPARRLMRLAARVMTSTAHWV